MHLMSEKIYSIRRKWHYASIWQLCFIMSFTNPYHKSVCYLLRPFIYIGLYLVWAIFFFKEDYQKNTPSLFNNDCSDDGFLDARSYV